MRTRSSTTRQSTISAAALPDFTEGKFGRLPDEILLEIIRHVRAFSVLEYEHVKSDKIKHVRRQTATVPLADGPKKFTVWTYQTPESSSNLCAPILNTFQGLAAVNRRIHALCQPLLWEKLEYPTSLPIPISRWMNEILPNHGAYVKSVKTSLTVEWFYIPSESSKINHTSQSQTKPSASSSRTTKPIKRAQRPSIKSTKDMDNLAHCDYKKTRLTASEEYAQSTGRRGLTPHNLTKILSKCPNLETLAIGFIDLDRGHHFSMHSPSDSAVWTSNIIGLMTGLGCLRHFSIRGPFIPWAFTDCIIGIVKSLPLLESLSLTNFAPGAGTDEEALAKELHELKNLTSLSLIEVHCLTGLWQRTPGPPKLVHLKIVDCENLRRSRASSFISAWAPNLTRLVLKFSSVGPSGQEIEDEVHQFNHDRHQFKLPLLTDLTLRDMFSFDVVYLNSFRTCHSINRLTHYDSNDHNIINLANALRASPNLRLSVLTLADQFSDEQPMRLLGGFCKSKGIKLIVLFNNFGMDDD